MLWPRPDYRDPRQETRCSILPTAFNAEQPLHRRFPCLGASHYAATADGHADQCPSHPEPWRHHAEHEHLWSQFQDRCREKDPTTPLKDIDSLPISSSGRARVCQIRVANPVYGGALNTSQSHPSPCQKSPFVIARTLRAIGGITGGIIRFFQAVTTAIEPSQNVFRLA